MTCRRQRCTPSCIDGRDRLQGNNSGRRGRLGTTAVAVRATVAGGGALVAVRLASVGRERGATRRGSWALHVASGVLVSALGVRIDESGSPRSGAALVVGNHLSWLDILVLSSRTPMRQVAKTEVGGWPVISGVAGRTGTIFLDRFRLRCLPGVVDQAAAALRQGHKVQAFPEATTRCGSAIGQFYRCLFQAAIDAAVVVAPVTLKYLDGDGRPTAAPAFLGDETLIDSVRRVLAVRGLRVQVHWLPAIPAIAGTGRPSVDRARLASLVERAVARDLAVQVVPRTVSASLADAAALRVA